MLFDLGCDSIQGYTISKPMNYNNTIDYIQNYSPDPRLKIVSNHLPKGADFKLLLAESNHKYWIELVLDSISRKEPNSLPQLSHKTCRLGKWLNQNGKKYFSQFESFNELIIIHKEIHKEVNSIIDLLDKNSYDASKEDIEKILSLKDRLISTIEQLKKEYSTTVKG